MPRPAYDDPAAIAEEVLRRISDHPETYDQESYGSYEGQVEDEVDTPELLLRRMGTSVHAWSDCGSTACVAGHAVAVGLESGYFLDRDMDEHVDVVAGWLLGLSYEQGAWLFSTKRAKAEVVEALTNIIEGDSDRI